MLSPDPMKVLMTTKHGRIIFLKGAGVVTAGYLLSMSCQMAAMVVLSSFHIPRLLIFFIYSAIFVAFWLVEAELFHRIQYKMSIRNSLTKKKSLVKWLTVCAAATLVFFIYNMIGGMAVTYAMAEAQPGIVKLLLRFCSILFQLRLPDIFLAACNFILYYRTMKYIIRTVEWG